MEQMHTVTNDRPLSLSGLPLGTSREYAEAEVRYLGLETLIGNFSAVRFHIRKTSPNHVSITVLGTWCMAGGGQCSLEYGGRIGTLHRLPDGRTMSIETVRPSQEFKIHIHQ